MRTAFLSFGIILLLALPVSAQLSKKEATENKVKSVSEWETDLRTRKPKAIQESFTKYDPEGNLIEILERDNAGEITLHEKYEYDLNGNKIVEIQLDIDGLVKKKHVYTYENHLRVARKTYNKDGDLIGEKKYIYEYYK